MNAHICLIYQYVAHKYRSYNKAKCSKGREKAKKGKFEDDFWYRFGRSQNIGIQHRIKLCIPRLVDRLYATIDEKGAYFLDNVDVGGITLKTSYTSYSLKYILCLINSKLLRWYFPFISAPFRGGWLSANRQFLSQLPISNIDFSNKHEKAQHGKMVKMVNQMLDLNKEITNAKSEQSKNIIQRRIDSIDQQIDSLVYKLYDLTDKEIDIIEKSS